MKKYTKIALVSLLAGTVSACSSGSSDEPAANDVSVNADTSTGPTDDQPGNTGSATGSGAADGSVTDGSTATDGSTTSGADGTTTADNGSETTTDGSTSGTDGTTTGAGEPGGSETTDGSTTSDGSDEGDTSGENPGGGDAITPSGTSSLGNPPTLADPFAEPLPGPDSEDPFGALLENDTEEPVAGGPPTTPKNLRVDLVSNDWAEFNWAPSNDDVGVVEYRIYRSDKTDGPTYIVREDTESPSVGTQDEIDKFWRTTSFIDCNYTRFTDQIHACAVNGPSPGDKFSYQVTAVDADGQESPRSNTITVLYHIESNAPVPRYNDFYKGVDDTFAQDHDLSNTAYFLDKFSMVFEDNFDGPAIDSTKWQTGLTWGDNQIINGEQQYFVNTQAQPGFGYNPFKFENGDLVIEAIRTPAEFVDSLPPVCEEEDRFGVDRCQFLSGALSSHDKFGITYGYVEGRMKVG